MLTRSFSAAALGLLAAGAHAQSTGVLNSAEIINPGNFKLAVTPAVQIGNDYQAFGAIVRGGYGFGPRVDGELKAGFYDGYTNLGADLEVGLVREPRFNLSLAAGGHFSRVDYPGGDLNVPGFDLTGLASVLVAPRLELYAGLDAAFEFPQEPDDPSIPVENYRRVYAVPGLEFRVSRQVDFLAEFGIGLNDETDEYAAVGFAFYLR